MSIKAMVWAIERHLTDPGEKLLLICIANYAGEQWDCYPSRAKLADDTSMSPATVKRKLAGLEARRLISRDQRFNENGRQGSNLITLLHVVGAQIEPPHPVGAQIEPGRGSLVSPLIEPSLEPRKRLPIRKKARKK